MLQAYNVEVVYDDVMLVLRGVSISVPPGEIVALLGANGAGKTTLLRALTGLLDVHHGRISRGAVLLDGEPVHQLRPAALVRRGISQVMEGRRIFGELTVAENLRLGAHASGGWRAGRGRDRGEGRDSDRGQDRDSDRGQDRDSDRGKGRGLLRERGDYVYSLFPVLAQRRNVTAGYLSGGEQQMLAMGRALMANPRYLLLDEPSLGLAPRLVEQVRDLIVEINQAGTGVLLVEQNATMALSIASHGYVLETGQVVLDKPAAGLLADQDIREFYLGLASATGAGDRRSYREVKHYRRRKRWLS